MNELKAIEVINKCKYCYLVLNVVFVFAKFQHDLSTFASFDLTASVIIRDKVGQNRSIDLQSCSESASNFTRKNKHTYILRHRIHKVMH